MKRAGNKIKRRKNEIERLEYELGRYQKKVEDQAKIIKAMQKRLEEAGEGAVQTMQYADCVCIQTAICYGEREEEDGKVIGYRLELPQLDIRALLERYEMRCRLDEERRVVVIGVMEREEKPDDPVGSGNM